MLAISQPAAMSDAATTSVALRTPRDSSQPPAMLPGAFTSTISAVARAAVRVETPCSSTRKVGSQIITEVHCAT